MFGWRQDGHQHGSEEERDLQKPPGSGSAAPGPPCDCLQAFVLLHPSRSDFSFTLILGRVDGFHEGKAEWNSRIIFWLLSRKTFPAALVCVAKHSANLTLHGIVIGTEIAAAQSLGPIAAERCQCQEKAMTEQSLTCIRISIKVNGRMISKRLRAAKGSSAPPDPPPPTSTSTKTN